MGRKGAWLALAWLHVGEEGEGGGMRDPPPTPTAHSYPRTRGMWYGYIWVRIGTYGVVAYDSNMFLVVIKIVLVIQRTWGSTLLEGAPQGSDLFVLGSIFFFIESHAFPSKGSQ